MVVRVAEDEAIGGGDDRVAPRREDARDLGQRPFQALGVFEDIEADDDIERAVRDWQRLAGRGDERQRQIVARGAQGADRAVGRFGSWTDRPRPGLAQGDDETAHPAAEVQDAPSGDRAAEFLDLPEAIGLITLLPEAALAPTREVRAPAHVRGPAIDERREVFLTRRS
jgi:hypothetical protein